jgi:HAD superfamily hydrolase (TIGR01509 family)
VSTAPPLRAVLFDFNGVLVDDETFHWRAFREVLAPFGVRLTRFRYNARYLVYDDVNALKAILHDARLDEAPLGRLLRRKRHIYARLARRVRIEPGAVRLVLALARRVPIAIVSGAARQEVAAVLGRARLTRLFSAVVTAEDVGRPKPWPDGYRLALRRLGLRSGRGCVAIEDSPGGVRAARAAGLTVVGVATTFAPSSLRRAGATSILRRLAAIEVKDLLGEGWSAMRRTSRTGCRPRKNPPRRETW